MREIKFRVWTGLTMEYRIVVGQLGAFYVAGLDPKDSACLSEFNTRYNEQTPVMQFTGLKDKNGKEVYEGDIFENQSGRGVITWVDEHACLGAIKVGTDERFVITSKGKTFATEVLGNIYENPELLED